MYKIIIPTFKRYEIIKSHTLKCIYKTDLKKDIYVFVADEDEYIKYAESLNQYTDIKIVIGKRGIPNQRNFIQKYFNENDNLLFIDDDIKKIIGLDKNDKRKEAIFLNDFIIDAFKTTDKLGLKMFGINSTTSNLEMKNTMSVGRIYIVGNFYGLINIHDLYVDEGEKIKARLNYSAGKESHERALMMYYRYGGVIKYRAFGVDSKYWGVEGGHQISRNNIGENEASIYLHNKYKNDTDLRDYKGISDIVIKAKTKVFNTNYFQ